MNREDSLYTEDWLKIARKDWQRIKRNLEDNDAEASGFYLQQALEKYLKAFLLKYDWKLKKIHALHDLLADAINSLTLQPLNSQKANVHGVCL